DHDHGEVGIEGAGALEDVHPADAVHAQVGHHEVEAPGLDAPERLLARRRGLDLVALLREQAAQRQEERLLVVDAEAAAHHAVTSAAAGSPGTRSRGPPRWRRPWSRRVLRRSS